MKKKNRFRSKPRHNFVNKKKKIIEVPLNISNVKKKSAIRFFKALISIFFFKLLGIIKYLLKYILFYKLLKGFNLYAELYSIFFFKLNVLVNIYYYYKKFNYIDLKKKSVVKKKKIKKKSILQQFKKVKYNKLNKSSKFWLNFFIKSFSFIKNLTYQIKNLNLFDFGKKYLKFIFDCLLYSCLNFKQLNNYLHSITEISLLSTDEISFFNLYCNILQYKLKEYIILGNNKIQFFYNNFFFFL